MSRYFPSEDRRSLVAVLVATLVLVGLVIAPFATADDLKDRQSDVKKQLSRAHNDLDESSAELRQATINLRNAQARLDKAQAKLSATRGELSASKARDEAARQALADAKEDLRRAREELRRGEHRVVRKTEQVGDRVAATYEKGDPRLASVTAILTSQDPDDVTRSLAATDAILDKENAVLTQLEAAKILLGVKEKQVERQKAKVQTKREEAAANLKEMRRLEKQAAKDAAAIASLVRDRGAAEAKAQKIRDRDRFELRKLEREQRRIKKMLRRRAEEARRRAEARKAAKRPSSSSHDRGYLSYPVNGRVTSSYGYRIHPIYGYRSLHDGVDFGAGCGEPLYAAANGVVVERYFQTAWGNRLIIDHGYQRGAGLATIYNHATKYVVSRGSYVRRGQLIGYVGTTGWSTGCHLHFTVMANGAPTNPMGWL